MHLNYAALSLNSSVAGWGMRAKIIEFPICRDAIYRVSQIYEVHRKLSRTVQTGIHTITYVPHSQEKRHKS